ncbi:MAG: thymidine kinase [Chloroflexi bacterium]|nr:MAG: thymidine kinase [Chloroflexota bacterium]TMD84390.1 MAG: thymidine kinase [Chloroflexota bacterium]
MINERYREDRERRRLGSLTVYSGPTHSGKTKKLEAEAERAQRQGRRMQRLTAPTDPNALLNELDPAAELVTVDDAQQYDDRLVEVLNDLATIHRMDVVVGGWELDYAGRPAGPMPELLCAADFALKLDDGVCAQPGCRNLASRTQRFQVVNGTPERFLPVCRRHHTTEARAQTFQEVWFDEPSGSLDLISGCMFSGKTQELIRRLDQARYAGFTVQAFKPALDDRYAIEAVASHREIRFPAIAVPNVAALRAQVQPDTRVIGIDEAQFFEPDIVNLTEELANRGRHVIIVGLDLDFLSRPFGPMPLLAAYADRLTKLQASCQYPGCGSRQATRTQRLVDGRPASADAPLVVIGGAAAYEARCRHHHRIGTAANTDAESVPVAEESAEL